MNANVHKIGARWIEDCDGGDQADAEITLSCDGAALTIDGLRDEAALRIALGELFAAMVASDESFALYGDPDAEACLSATWTVASGSSPAAGLGIAFSVGDDTLAITGTRVGWSISFELRQLLQTLASSLGASTVSPLEPTAAMLARSGAVGRVSDQLDGRAAA